MGSHKHEQERVKSGHTTAPAGRNDMTDQDHALRAGKDGPSPRKSATDREPSTRDEGSDDRRSGSESGKS